MATILLQAAGGLVGGLIGGPFGAIAGRALGALGGAAIDNMLFSQTRSVEGTRLTTSRVVEADEGAGVAQLFGTARIAGQVIWTTRFEETSETERQGGKGGGGGVEVTTYSYFGNVAIGLCEGPVAGIRRVWADGEELDLTAVTWRLYAGTEEQLPDPLIEAKQGEGNAPAYRGLAYIVFERMPLERWGNRIPQIACEVIRPVGDLERRMTAVALIPGATEHGLDPDPVRETLDEGEDEVLNRHCLHGVSDIEASLDELQALAPALQRVALAVAWFGTDLRAGHCQSKPGVETRLRDESETWRVGGTERGDAHLISTKDGGPAYGGTPSDAGVVRAIRDLAARGLAVTYYPFLLMDIPPGNGLADPYGAAEQGAYPWRGRISLDVAVGEATSPDGTTAADDAIAAFIGTADVDDFSLSGRTVSYHGPDEWSYRRMILHQAHLAKAAGGVAAFVIGSELRGLTRIRGAEGNFPFVDALIALAEAVKMVLPEALVTYAADWSEYFGYQPADGSGDVFYNLDALWACSAIDMVGIDNYLPIADWRTVDWSDGGPDAIPSPYDRDALRAGIRGGECYDWYYASDEDRRQRRRTPITDGEAAKPWVFRAKDLWNWWAMPHVERRGGLELGEATAWAPKGKPIWFTELGCPAVDKGANQPNVFVDPKSAESALPHASSGAEDSLAQRRFLEAHLAFWNPQADGFEAADNPVSPVYGTRMVEPTAIHLWAWDARPYPTFPDRTDIWSDGPNWRRGHWLSGRFGRAPLGDLIAELLSAHGFADFDVGAVDAEVAGYLIDGPVSARAALEDLLTLTGTVAYASGDRLVFRSLRRAGLADPIAGYVDADETPIVEYRRAQADELPDEIVVGFSDPSRDYQTGAADALLAGTDHPRQETVELPVVLGEGEARRLAASVLADRLGARESARFAISPAEIGRESGDVVRLDGRAGDWLVTRIETGLSRRLEARRLPERAYETRDTTADLPAPRTKAPAVASRPLVHWLDLPLMEGGEPESAARIAIHAVPWVPYAVQASATGSDYTTRLIQARRATVGTLVESLEAGPEGLIDRANRIVVDLKRGALFSITREQLLAGGNLCAVRSGGADWEVLQFETAEEVASMRFVLSGLLRAQGGTEDAMAVGASAGSAFVLLDEGTAALDLRTSEIGREIYWRVLPSGRPIEAATRVEAVTNLGSRAMLPLSPVHLCATFAADGAVTITWLRRTRIGGDRWEGLDVPLGEEDERYALTLSDEVGRTLSLETATPRAVVDAADQIEAFGALPVRLSATVSQVSVGYGAGTARRRWFDRQN
ncbi:baseplate multidomain protein megatron [Consotaella aegiceratis]|uniref:baseplate multidomain protein megatron n=1 Tax=Consotaella aegiceratis TaxID=3097961 RepID=UPI002F41B251